MAGCNGHLMKSYTDPSRSLPKLRVPYQVDVLLLVVRRSYDLKPIFFSSWVAFSVALFTDAWFVLDCHFCLAVNHWAHIWVRTSYGFCWFLGFCWMLPLDLIVGEMLNSWRYILIQWANPWFSKRLKWTWFSTSWVSCGIYIWGNLNGWNYLERCWFYDWLCLGFDSLDLVDWRTCIKVR